MTGNDAGSRRNGSARRIAGEARELPSPLRRIAEGYHPPPPTPREKIWADIEVGLAGHVASGSFRWPVGWSRLAAAIALVAIGFGAGRGLPGSDRSSAAAGTAPTGDGTVAVADAEASGRFDREAVDYLTSSGALLASVRSDAREGVVGPGVGPWGRGLLQETRLLLDSPAADDPAMRALLEDLELVLAQVALLSDRERVGEARGREELQLIARGLDRRELLPRIHAVLPGGNEVRTEEGDR